MIITCPNCATHYDVKPEAIRPTGSMMRCARCGYSWQQSVIHSVEVREQQMTMAAPGMVAAAPAAAQAQPMVVAAPPPPPPPMPEPDPIPEPEPEPIPEPEPEPEPEPIPEPEPEPEPEAEEEPLSQDELDNLFGEEEALPPIESMVDSNIDDDEAETIEVEDDEDELDAIPEGLTTPLLDDDDEIPVGRPHFKKPPVEKKKPIAMIIGIIFAVLFIGVAGGGIALKDTIIEAMPMAKDYYVMAGLHTVEPGEGLSHEDVKPRRDVRNGVDFLIIEGNVINIAEGPLAVPMLKVELTNTEGKAIRTSITELPKTQLEPGDKIPFKVEFENPPGTARSMTLGFADAEEAAQANGDGH